MKDTSGLKPLSLVDQGLSIWRPLPPLHQSNLVLKVTGFEISIQKLCHGFQYAQWLTDVGFKSVRLHLEVLPRINLSVYWPTLGLFSGKTLGARVLASSPKEQTLQPGLKMLLAGSDRTRASNPGLL